MSKLKDKSKANIRTDISVPDANQKAINPESAQLATIVGSAEKKVVAAIAAKKTASSGKMRLPTHNCWVWPD